MLSRKDPCALLELIFLSLLHMTKALAVLSSAQGRCVFLSNSNTKMQWAEVLGLLLLAAGRVMLSAFSHRAGVLPWN